MKLKVSRAVVWAADIEDRPGGLAESLEALGNAGTNLDFILARRAAESPGQGVVFVAPLKGGAQIRAASNAGFLKTEILHALRVEGANKPGVGGAMARAIANAGINLRGFSAAATGKRFLAYLAFDNAPQTTKAMRAFKRLS
jgi:hypothetical protein